MKTQLRQYIGNDMSRKGQSVLGTWIDPPFWDDAICRSWHGRCTGISINLQRSVRADSNV
jgi:hypothetical protein